MQVNLSTRQEGVHIVGFQLESLVDVVCTLRRLPHGVSDPASTVVVGRLVRRKLARPVEVQQGVFEIVTGSKGRSTTCESSSIGGSARVAGCRWRRRSAT